MATVFIYALKEPDTGEIRYIGKAKNPQKRLSAHLSRAVSDRRVSHKNSWVMSLLNRRLRPILEIIDEVSEEDWGPIEAAYIQFYREEGFDLVNGTFGGDGIAMRGDKHPMFGKHHSQETKEKLSKVKTGIPLPETARKKLVGNKNALNSNRTEENREKISKALSGSNSPRFGIKDSDETRLKKSLASKIREEKIRQEKTLAVMWR